MLGHIRPERMAWQMAVLFYEARAVTTDDVPAMFMEACAAHSISFVLPANVQAALAGVVDIGPTE